MFTGIIQAVGHVTSFSDGVLTLSAPADFAPDGYKLGESIAVNGCCLTVIVSDAGIKFELSPETIARTAFRDIKLDSQVNLERAMQVNDRFGGHIVQGHVDATGTIVSITPSGNSTVFRFQAPTNYDRYMIDKGSITVDGISLTVVKPNEGCFDVWIIPHTLAETNLGQKQIGDSVNLEFDVIARYVEKMMGVKSSD